VCLAATSYYKRKKRRLLTFLRARAHPCVCVELVQGYQLPLCSDAYTGMMRHDPNFIQHNEEVRQATEVKSQRSLTYFRPPPSQLD
jgi:hypothetical protein